MNHFLYYIFLYLSFAENQQSFSKTKHKWKKVPNSFQYFYLNKIGIYLFSASLLNCVSYVLLCRHMLRAYVLTYTRALSAYVHTCQRVLGTYLLTCQRALRFLCLHANMPCVTTCSHALRAYVFTCLACLNVCGNIYFEDSVVYSCIFLPGGSL